MPIWKAREGDGACGCGNPECGSPAKHPVANLVPNGLHSASILQQDIDKWFKDERYNIAIRTGDVSGLVVLDVDPRHGGDESLKVYGTPETLRVDTGGGGQHYYFQYPKEGIRNSVGRAGYLGMGLDIRGDNGYVLAPPSNHVSGGKYVFAVDPRACKILPCPPWILNAKKDRCSVKEITDSEKKIPVGQRHSEMVAYAGAHRARGETAKEVLDILRTINENRCEEPLPDEELAQIAAGSAKWPQGEGAEMIVTPFSEIKPEEVTWLWEPWIPMQETTLVFGAGEAGKSTLLSWMAARVSSGGQWYKNNGHTTHGSVIYLSDEENPHTQIRPRLDANGADVGKVYYYRNIQAGKGRTTVFSISKYLYTLENLIATIGDVKLLILDPVVAYLGRANANDNVEVRTALLKLTNLARKHNLAIVCNTHINKKPDLELIQRAIGSVAFANAVRSAMAVAKEIDEDGKWTGMRLMELSKKNLHKEQRDVPTLKWEIKDAGVYIYDECAERSISEMTRNPKKGKKEKKEKKGTKEFRNWLKEQLDMGHVAVKLVFEMAERMGVPSSTVYRVRNELSAVSDAYGTWGYADEEPPI